MIVTTVPSLLLFGLNNNGAILLPRLKFGLSEKHTKFEKNLPYGFDKSADLLSKRQNHEEDFFQMLCASQKVRTLKEYPSFNHQ